jgi:hypothetical protein
LATRLRYFIQCRNFAQRTPLVYPVLVFVPNDDLLRYKPEARAKELWENADAPSLSLQAYATRGEL